jgi:hypothetical protein
MILSSEPGTKATIPEILLQISAVSIATGYGIQDLRIEVRMPTVGKYFLFSRVPRLGLGPTHILMGTEALYPEENKPEVKRLGREVELQIHLMARLIIRQALSLLLYTFSRPEN